MSPEMSRRMERERIARLLAEQRHEANRRRWRWPRFVVGVALLPYALVRLAYELAKDRGE